MAATVPTLAIGYKTKVATHSKFSSFTASTLVLQCSFPSKVTQIFIPEGSISMFLSLMHWPLLLDNGN